MAREGLLIHAQEDLPESHPSEPNTPHKKAENFWYYHKWHILAALMAVIVLCFMVHDFLSPKVDYEIGMITSKYYPQEVVTLLEDNIAKYAEDLNGDGRVIVRINPYAITSDIDDPELRLANQVKLDSDLASGISLLFITDEDSFLTQQERSSMFATTEGIAPQTDSVNQEQMRIPIPKLKALSNLSYQRKDGTNVMQELGLSLRVYEGSAADGQEDEYWNACQRLLQKLARG